MLSYLVTSEVRRKLLKLLWLDRLSASVSELSRLANVGFASAYQELKQMEKAGLAESKRDANTVCFHAHWNHPHAELLKNLLISDVDSSSSPEIEKGQLEKVSDNDILLNFVKYGGPLGLSGEPKCKLSLEMTLALALKVSHTHPSVARSFPVALYRNKELLDVNKLFFWTDRLNEKQALGFFLDLTTQLSGDASFHRMALKLRDQRVKKLKYFFETKAGKFTQTLAQRNNPVLAKKWHFVMNMGMDAFESLFKKFCETT